MSKSKTLLSLLEEDQMNWVCVSLDSVYKDAGKKWVCLGFKSEKDMDKAESFFKNYSDVTVFAVDVYGKASESAIRGGYDPLKVITGKEPTTALVKEVYTLLKKV